MAAHESYAGYPAKTEREIPLVLLESRHTEVFSDP